MSTGQSMPIRHRQKRRQLADAATSDWKYNLIFTALAQKSLHAPSIGFLKALSRSCVLKCLLPKLEDLVRAQVQLELLSKLC
jgi:hypothetical protein